MSIIVGKKVALKNKDLGAYLSGGKKDGDAVTHSKGDPTKDPTLQWVITNLHGDIYVIKSVSSQCFLDGRYKLDEKVLVSKKSPEQNQCLKWRIEKGYYDKNFLIFKCVSTGGYVSGPDLKFGNQVQIYPQPSTYDQSYYHSIIPL